MSEPRKIQGYGWKPDTPDHRDRIFNLEEKVEVESALPNVVSQRNQFPDAYDQAQLGSCTGNAWAGEIEHQQIKQKLPYSPFTPSRLFIYYNERVLENTVSTDSGAEIRDGAKVVSNLGAPPESYWPYSDANPGPFSKRPNNLAYSDALKHRAIKYQRVLTTGPGAPVRTALNRGNGIVFGFSVPDTFEDPSWNPQTTPLSLPGPNNQIVGGHAVVVIGYDWSLTRFKVPVFEVRNSWGTSWGDNGHFYMDYRWFSSSLASDFWTITLES